MGIDIANSLSEGVMLLDKKQNLFLAGGAQLRQRLQGLDDRASFHEAAAGNLADNPRMNDNPVLRQETAQERI